MVDKLKLPVARSMYTCAAGDVGGVPVLCCRAGRCRCCRRCVAVNDTSEMKFLPSLTLYDSETVVSADDVGPLLAEHRQARSCSSRSSRPLSSWRRCTRTARSPAAWSRTRSSGVGLQRVGVGAASGDGLHRVRVEVHVDLVAQHPARHLSQRAVRAVEAEGEPVAVRERRCQVDEVVVVASPLAASEMLDT